MVPASQLWLPAWLDDCVTLARHAPSCGLPAHQQLVQNAAQTPQV
jgi:hypothetical protein